MRERREQARELPSEEQKERVSSAGKDTKRFLIEQKLRSFRRKHYRH
ncbi:MAG: hypothetical protein KHX22_08040 [Clostridiales bacterium]|nr:hypothetical protein [Clostridiales bacterium]